MVVDAVHYSGTPIDKSTNKRINTLKFDHERGRIMSTAGCLSQHVRLCEYTITDMPSVHFKDNQAVTQDTSADILGNMTCYVSNHMLHLEFAVWLPSSK